MKKLIIIGSLTAFTGFADAQAPDWAGVASTTGDLYRTGNVGIGTSSPVLPLDIRGYATVGGGATTANYNVSPFANERHLYVTGNSSGGGNAYGSVILGSNDTEAANQWLGGLVFGQKVTGKSAGAAGLKAAIRGLSSGSGGSTSGFGGNLIFCTNGDNSSTIVPERMRIDMNGNVGIGTASPGNARLNVFNDSPYSSAGAPTSKWAVKADIQPPVAMVSDGYQESSAAIEGNAITNYTGEGFLYGVVARGRNGLNNYGGYFDASLGNASYVGAANFGVWTKGSGNYRSYGIYAQASGATLENWAGYFQGNVNINGQAYCTSSAWSSDLKLKKDIKPITNSLEKIRLLKPSTYTFKTEEAFKYMNLPKELQLGLIAQELEEVFPYLVTEVAENIQKDASGKEILNIPSHKMVNYIGLIPVLISAIQDQDKTSQAQESKIESLYKTLEAQQQQLADQKQMIDALVNKAGTSTGINENSLVPAGFNLEQNEPNPFTNETVIKYTIPNTVISASMVVYDLSGKQIASFPLTEKGSSSVAISSEKLAAGIYIYSVMADGKIIDSKRMVVAGK